MKITTIRTGALAGIAATVATPALAHHPLAGAPMETFGQGVLSGIGHPVLGFDHLLFVVLVGIAASLINKARSAPAAYIAAMLAGCLAMTAGIGLPLKEVVIGLSLLVLGAMVLSGRSWGAGVMLGLFALFGLFHGSAFGDTIAGQEGGAGFGILAGYLIGLGLVQYVIAVASGWMARTLFGAADAAATGARLTGVRLTGAVVAGAGLLLTLENAEGMVFSAMGWAS